MDQYNKYVTAINKIFEHMALCKTNWPDQDNLNYIESIEEYRNIVKEASEKIKNINSQQQTAPQPNQQQVEQPTKLEG